MGTLAGRERVDDSDSHRDGGNSTGAFALAYPEDFCGTGGNFSGRGCELYRELQTQYCRVQTAIPRTLPGQTNIRISIIPASREAPVKFPETERLRMGTVGYIGDAHGRCA